MTFKLFFRIRGIIPNGCYHKESVRFSHKTSGKSILKEPKVAKDVVSYIESNSEYKYIREHIPNSLLRKYTSTENMYLINSKTAESIAITLQSHLDVNSPVIEVNPGFGFLSKELLKSHRNKHYLYESSNHFTKFLEELKREYPDRVTSKVADFFGMWKLAFQDKMDNGDRIQQLLGNLITTDSERIVKVVGAMPSLSFVKHLINNIVFHNTSNQLGRPDLFITMPGYHYEFLTDNEIQMSRHRSTPALFQLFFDYKILDKVPTVHFLPWVNPPISKRVTMMDQCSLYLVNITQKEKLPCPADYLPLLWYFFKPLMFAKTTRIIPMLEQWIPGCGIWLITGQDPPETNKSLSPNHEDASLPHMTIFTEFGDLTLGQKVTIFKKFISWPGFEQSPFRLSMESNLPKFVSNLEDDKDTMATHIDDLEHSDTETDTLQ